MPIVIVRISSFSSVIIRTVCKISDVLIISFLHQMRCIASKISLR